MTNPSPEYPRIEITRHEFINWIMQQPPNRMVNMMRGQMLATAPECGCLMVEYVREEITSWGTADHFVSKFQIIRSGYNCMDMQSQTMRTEDSPSWQFIDFDIRNLILHIEWSKVIRFRTFGDFQKQLIAEGQVSSL